MPNKVFVVGVGMTKFEKPGRREGWDYPDMARESGTNALEGRGHRLLRGRAGLRRLRGGRLDVRATARSTSSGMTGIPIANVNNNCSTGSTALFLAAQTIRGGLADCAIALGFEKMQPGPLQGGAEDRESPMGKHVKAMAEIDEFAFPVAPWMFGAAGREHMQPIRHHRRAFREDRLQEPQALGEQPVRAVPGGVLARRHPGGQDDLRSADQAAVLADLRRVGRGDRGQRGVRRQARAGRPGRGDRRAGDDHRLRQHLRRQRQEPHRLRHECPSRTEGLRPVRARPVRLPGDRAARLLLRQRAAAV